MRFRSVRWKRNLTYEPGLGGPMRAHGHGIMRAQTRNPVRVKEEPAYSCRNVPGDKCREVMQNGGTWCEKVLLGLVRTVRAARGSSIQNGVLVAVCAVSPQEVWIGLRVPDASVTQSLHMHVVKTMRRA